MSPAKRCYVRDRRAYLARDGPRFGGARCLLTRIASSETHRTLATHFVAIGEDQAEIGNGIRLRPWQPPHRRSEPRRDRTAPTCRARRRCDLYSDDDRADAVLGTQLALIVRGADTSRPELTPQSPGLLAISLGLKATIADDHEVLRFGFVMYDALFAWIRSAQGESHSWPPKMTAA